MASYFFLNEWTKNLIMFHQSFELHLTPKLQALNPAFTTKGTEGGFVVNCEDFTMNFGFYQAGAYVAVTAPNLRLSGPQDNIDFLAIETANYIELQWLRHRNQ